MSKPRFSITFDVDAPPRRVFDVMKDVERWHEWTPSVTSITLRPPGQLEVGGRAVIRQPKFPPAMWEISAIDPDRSFTWVSRAPGVRVFAHHSVEPTTNGTRVTLSLAYDGLLGGVIAKLTEGITNRYLQMEADGLKARSVNPAYRHAS